MMKEYDVTILGGGIVGLATGWQLLQANPDLRLLIVEKESAIATHQTDRNSGVIHSGIYYKPGGAKAINCIKGYSMLLEFCRHHAVPFDLCGKVIVAQNEQQLPALEGIFHRGVENGLQGIAKLDPQDVSDIEPHCRSIGGIWVPQAGIIDYREVANTLSSLILRKGGEIMTGFDVKHIEEKNDHVILASPYRTVVSRYAIACAGLYADRLAKIAGLAPPHKIVPFRGEFYALDREASAWVRGLIYPVPDLNFPFLGVHLTKRIHGGVEAGPNAVLAFRREGYKHLDIHAGELLESLRYSGFQHLARRHWRKGLDEMKRSFFKSAFLKSVQALVPELQAAHLTRSRTGVRAQALDKHGQLVDDYVVMEQPRIIHLLNAPSPAATSCLAIGAFLTAKFLQKTK